MSFQTLKRITPHLVFTFFTASTLLAAAPSSRTGSRAVYDEEVLSVVMFGGMTAPDAATGRAYALSETWEFDGTRWIRRHPAGSPPGRASHAMVYDSNRDQSIIFGGRAGSDLLADTWAYRGDWYSRRWEQIETPNAPAARHLPAAAFDPLRDRMVIYGGQNLSEDGREFVNLYDMWEFDGTTWTQVMAEGPKIRKPLLSYDEARNQLILLGNDETLATQMYIYDAAAQTWNEVTPEALPPCVNDSAITYDSDKHLTYVIGGVCVPSDPTKSSPSTEELFAWDGTTWTKVTTERTLFRSVDAAFAYYGNWQALVMFGGTVAYTSNPRADTSMFFRENWVTPPLDVTSPSPRSLFAMSADPVNEAIWLLGGSTEGFPASDFWKFQDGFWHRVEAEETPACDSPLSAFDKDRSRLVVVCGDSSTHEWNGEAWQAFTNLSKKPENRRFSHLVYDENLKKTVLYGGYNAVGDYLDQTWTWNGTAWTEVNAKRRPHLRSLAAMWYDPILRKTVLYGGIGRKEREGRLERFNDMWSFDGSTWTELSPATVPPTRYGAQVGVNPITNRTVLFGGLVLETVDNVQRQVYANDTWEWNGSTWRQITTPGAIARENSRMAWDYSGEGFILFGGWAGHFLSDTWLFTDDQWYVFAE